MDEAYACYFAHKFMDQKCGFNSNLLHYPSGLEWLPNIPRESYRYSTMYGVIGRGEQTPIVQDMPKFGHIANLFGMCYDKGSKVVGMIADRLGPDGFIDFIHRIHDRYRYRIIRVADVQRELEEYTGQSWDQFFKQWLYGSGMCDWSVEKVKVEPLSDGQAAPTRPGYRAATASCPRCTTKRMGRRARSRSSCTRRASTTSRLCSAFAWISRGNPTTSGCRTRSGFRSCRRRTPWTTRNSRHGSRPWRITASG